MKNKGKIEVYFGRTRFARDIVAEFWMPRRHSQKAIILCDGCPSMPSKRKLAEFFARKGYWVFHPRYRGSWESGGKFLEQSPEEDVLSVAEGLNAGWKNIYDDIEYVLDIKEITVVGVSFGGAAAILSLKYPSIVKAIAISPLIDWKAKSRAEPFGYFVRMITEGFGEGYRVHKDAWKRLASGKFYNPISEAKHIDSKRLFVLHAIDDDVVPVVPLRKFAKQIKLSKDRLWIMNKGGHLPSTVIMQPEVWKRVKKFLAKR